VSSNKQPVDTTAKIRSETNVCYIHLWSLWACSQQIDASLSSLWCATCRHQMSKLRLHWLRNGFRCRPLSEVSFSCTYTHTQVSPFHSKEALRPWSICGYRQPRPNLRSSNIGWLVMHLRRTQGGEKSSKDNRLGGVGPQFAYYNWHSSCWKHIIDA
jgi:hypothetical protein